MLPSPPGATSCGICVTSRGVVMLTFSISIGAEPGLLRTKSCSTTAPDRTSPNSNRAPGKTAFCPLDAAPCDAKPCLAVRESCAPVGATTYGAPQEARRGNKLRKEILLVARKIIKGLRVGFRRGRGELGLADDCRAWCCYGIK